MQEKSLSLTCADIQAVETIRDVQPIWDVECTWSHFIDLDRFTAPSILKQWCIVVV